MVSKSTIFINDNIPSQQTMRGVARYFHHILEGIIKHFGDQVIIFSPKANSYGPAKYFPSIRVKGSEQFALHDRLATLLSFKLRPKLVYNTWTGPMRTQAPKIFTIYDLTYEFFPEYWSRWWVPFRNLMKERENCVRQATALIAISHSTAQDLAEFYQVDPAKIVVTHLGVAPFFFQSAAGNDGESCKPYLLYIGTRGGYKNFDNLLLAYAKSELAADFNLKVISSMPFTMPELEIIRQYRLETCLELISGVDEAKLRSAYANAAAFIYPSLYEGFGLPILEAMASGAVVATSNVASMPEVGGDTAFYFEPNRVESIVECLKKVVSMSPVERARRIEAGRQHARQFTWERCQQQTVQLFEQLLSD